MTIKSRGATCSEEGLDGGHLECLAPFGASEEQQDTLGINNTPKPFLKWVGGKSKLVPYIREALPKDIRTYFEPFVGGGAVFFFLRSRRHFRNAVIGDRNGWLTETYIVVRDKVDQLIVLLREHQPHATDSEYYYALRALSNETLEPVERAAKLIFLNKTCYNGLFRVNRAGEFNVPFGRHINPRILNEDVLRSASAALTGVKVVSGDFEVVVDGAGHGDAVYVDPPYYPLSITSSFTAYDPFPFGADEQRRLGEAFKAWASKGISCVLSNSDCPFTRELFAGLTIRTVEASRAINCVGGGRGRVNEILVIAP